jgi:hypothetical protein
MTSNSTTSTDFRYSNHGRRVPGENRPRRHTSPLALTVGTYAMEGENPRKQPPMTSHTTRADCANSDHGRRKSQETTANDVTRH